MKLLFQVLMLLCLVISSSWAKDPIRVAVIDTGLNLADSRFTHLCKTGHRDFTNTGIQDDLGHGTHVTSLIEKYAGAANYCIIIIKIYTQNNLTNGTYAEGILWALKAGATIVNVSGGGNIPDKFEYETMKQNPQTLFITAAGNWGENLASKSPFYPAAYDLPNQRIIGSVDTHGKRSVFSNYGVIVRFWENGEFVRGFVPDGEALMSGTSQATAIHTGKVVRLWSN